MAGGLVDHVHEDPSEVDGALAVRRDRSDGVEGIEPVGCGATTRTGAGIEGQHLVDRIVPARIGTVTETLDAICVCRNAGYAQMISHRSEETTDALIADLAVATGCGQIKSGAPAPGERVAK